MDATEATHPVIAGIADDAGLDRSGGAGLHTLDDIAVSHALHRGELEIVVRYLREIAAPLIRNRSRGQICSTATIHMIADMLEERPNASWHLKLKRPRQGNPNAAATLLENIRIGSWIASQPGSGWDERTGKQQKRSGVLLGILEDARIKFGVKNSQARECFALYRKYWGHNSRCEPMPIPDRPKRKSRKSNHKD
jgi:hypothetical protein